MSSPSIDSNQAESTTVPAAPSYTVASDIPDFIEPRYLGAGEDRNNDVQGLEPDERKALEKAMHDPKVQKAYYEMTRDNWKTKVEAKESCTSHVQRADCDHFEIAHLIAPDLAKFSAHLRDEAKPWEALADSQNPAEIEKGIKSITKLLRDNRPTGAGHYNIVPEQLKPLETKENSVNALNKMRADYIREHATEVFKDIAKMYHDMADHYDPEKHKNPATGLTLAQYASGQKEAAGRKQRTEEDIKRMGDLHQARLQEERAKNEVHMQFGRNY